MLGSWRRCLTISAFGSSSHDSVSSEFSFYSAADSSAGLTPAGPPNPIPRWRLPKIDIFRPFLDIWSETINSDFLQL